MTRTVVGFLALLILLPVLRASDKASKQTPQQQYQKLVREYEKAMEEHEKAREKENVALINSKFAQAFLKLAKNNPKTPIAADALIRIAVSFIDLNNDPQSPRNQAMRILLRDHVESEKLTIVCLYLQMFKSEADSRKLLRGVLEKNPHRSARAHACLTLAQHAESNISVARELKEQPAEVKDHEFMGKEYVEALIKAKPEELRKEVEVLYERIVKDFADVPRMYVGENDVPKKGSVTLGEIAKAKLEALRHPVLVGKPAPEIEGKDIEGKKLKLSDYRGKIVMLIFWASGDTLQSMYEYERALVKRMKDKPFVLIGVNNDEDRGELKKVMIKEKITWRSFLDGYSIFIRWSGQYRPRLFLIDAKGVIRYKNEEVYLDYKKLDEEIDKLVAEVKKTAAK